MSEDTTTTGPADDAQRRRGSDRTSGDTPPAEGDRPAGDGRPTGADPGDDGGSPAGDRGVPATGPAPGSESAGAELGADPGDPESVSDADGEGSMLTDLVSGVRFGQFVSVGVVGATTETLVVAALTAGFGVVAQVAKLVGAEASITLMFLINDRWTFAGEGGAEAGSLLRRYLKSHGVRLGGLVVGFAVLTLLVDYTDVTLLVAGVDFWPTVANAIGIGMGMVLNYVAESLITWKVHR